MKTRAQLPSMRRRQASSVVPTTNAAFTAGGQRDQFVDVGVVVKTRDIFPGRDDRRVQADRGIQPPGAGLRPERIHAIRAKGVTVAKAVAFQCIAQINAHGLLIRHPRFS
jgi:hypothetical protein